MMTLATAWFQGANAVATATAAAATPAIRAHHSAVTNSGLGGGTDNSGANGGQPVTGGAPAHGVLRTSLGGSNPSGPTQAGAEPPASQAAVDLKELGGLLGLTSGELAQVFVAALGAVGGLSAAWAAWRASRIGEESLRELREARLQPVRPALTAAMAGEMRFYQHALHGAQMQVREGKEVPWHEGAALISVANLGLGTAWDVDFTLDARTLRLPRGATRSIGRVFDGPAAGRFKHNRHEVLISGPLHFRSLPNDGNATRGDPKICRVGDSVSWPLPEDTMMQVCFAALAHELSAPEPLYSFRSKFPLYVNCRSIAGEKLSYKYFLHMRPDRVMFRLGGHRAAPYSAGLDWESFDIVVDLSIREQENEYSFPGNLGYAIFWSVFGNEKAIEYLTGKPKRLRKHEAWVRRNARRTLLKQLRAKFSRVRGKRPGPASN